MDLMSHDLQSIIMKRRLRFVIQTSAARILEVSCGKGIPTPPKNSTAKPGAFVPHYIDLEGAACEIAGQNDEALSLLAAQGQQLLVQA